MGIKRKTDLEKELESIKNKANNDCYSEYDEYDNEDENDEDDCDDINWKDYEKESRNIVLKLLIVIGVIIGVLVYVLVEIPTEKAYVKGSVSVDMYLNDGNTYAFETYCENIETGNKTTVNGYVAYSCQTSYEGLEPGEKYYINGYLVKDTWANNKIESFIKKGLLKDSNGNPIIFHGSFVAINTKGYIDVTFCANSDIINLLKENDVIFDINKIE